MAVEPLLATRAQRAFIGTSELSVFTPKVCYHHADAAFSSSYNTLVSAVVFWILQIGADDVRWGFLEAIVVLVMIGITFRMVCCNFR